MDNGTDSAAVPMSSRRPRVLLTLPDRPHPADGGKRRRASATLRALADLDLDLDLAVLRAGEVWPPPVPPELRLGQVLQIDSPPRNPLIALAVTTGRQVPYQIAAVRWQTVRRRLNASTADSYDLVWFGSTDHAISLARHVRATRTVVDMDDVEVHKLRAYLSLPSSGGVAERLERLQRRIEVPLWATVQRRVLQVADVLVVCSELDRRRVGGKDVRVVANGYPAGDAPARAPEEHRPPTVLLVGTYSYAPNVDAAIYAAEQVLPALRVLLPDARLRLVGRDAERLPPRLAALDGVELVGEVLDTGQELSAADVSLASVRYGGGTRVKILEAFAHAVPVVSTPLGCEGLDVEDGEHLLVGHDAVALAAACAALLQDPSAARKVGEAGRRLLIDNYSPGHIREQVHAVVAEVLSGPPSRS